MKRKHNDRNECKEAYDNFDPDSFEVGGVKITHIPEKPHHTKIDNYGLPREQRRFKPVKFPTLVFDKETEECLGFRELDEQQAEAFLRQLYEYRTKGYWFYNGDNLEYITGDHWYYLNFIKIDVFTKDSRGVKKKVKRLPNWVDSDRNFFYFWREAELDDFSFGMMFISGRRTGKALDINTPIPTPEGFKKMQDLRVGDIVFGADGEQVEIDWVSPIQYNRIVNRVWFDDGTWLDADDDHQWEVTTKASRKWASRDKRRVVPKEVLTTREIKQRPLRVSSKGERNFHIDLCKPVQYKEKNLPADPYLYGYWLGDGRYDGTSITVSKEDLPHLLEKIESLSLEYTLSKTNTAISVYIKGIRTKWIENDLLFKKRIPEIFKQSSIKQRIELIRGIMDSDGHISTLSNGTHTEVTQKRKELSEDIIEVLRSLGVKATMKTKIANLNDYECEVYRISFNSNFNPFRLNRKAKKWKSPKSPRRKIKSIEKIEELKSVPVKCISVKSDRKVYLAGKSYTITHNTAKALSIMLNAATITPEACVGIQAQNTTTAKSLFKRMVRTWRELPRHPFVYPEHTGDSNPSSILRFEQSAKRSTKKQNYSEKEVLNSWIDYRSTTEHAYDGEGMFRLFIDEASKIEGCDINELYNVNRETMADGPYAWGKMVMTSTAENIGGKTLPAFEKMFRRSDVANRNELGQTASGIWGYFQPATMGYRFDPKDVKKSSRIDVERFEASIDEFGYSNEEAARQLILAQRELLTGSDLIQFTRKYPLTIEEAFAVEKGESPFNTKNINDQLKYNLEIEVAPRRGSFEWIGEGKKEVIFYPAEDGKWELSWMPPEEHRCALKQDYAGLIPIYKECWTGVDPYEADKTVEKGSDAAATTWVNAGQFFPRRTKVCRYVHRPSTAEQMFDDILKQCVFYSSYANIENNAGRGIIRQWKKWGFGGLILPDPLYPDKHPEGTNTRSLDTRNEMLNVLRTYIEHDIGLIDEDKYEYGTCDFNEGLKEWRNMEADNWTPYDEVVADMLALHGIPKQIYRPKKLTLDQLVYTYDNTGNTSKLI